MKYFLRKTNNKKLYFLLYHQDRRSHDHPLQSSLKISFSAYCLFVRYLTDSIMSAAYLIIYTHYARKENIESLMQHSITHINEMK